MKIRKKNATVFHQLKEFYRKVKPVKPGDEFEVVGENGTNGLTWAPEDGEYYVGIGTLGENNPAGEGFKLDVTIERNLQRAVIC